MAELQTGEILKECAENMLALQPHCLMRNCSSDRPASIACDVCKVAFYCCEECKQLDRPLHRIACKPNPISGLSRERMQALAVYLKRSNYPKNAHKLAAAILVPPGTDVMACIQQFDAKSNRGRQNNIARFGWTGGHGSSAMPGYTLEEPMHYLLYFDDSFLNSSADPNELASILLCMGGNQTPRGNFIVTKHDQQGERLPITKAEIIDIIMERCAAGLCGGVTDRIHAENIRRATCFHLLTLYEPNVMSLGRNVLQQASDSSAFSIQPETRHEGEDLQNTPDALSKEEEEGTQDHDAKVQYQADKPTQESIEKDQKEKSQVAKDKGHEEHIQDKASLGDSIADEIAAANRAAAIKRIQRRAAQPKAAQPTLMMAPPVRNDVQEAQQVLSQRAARRENRKKAAEARQHKLIQQRQKQADEDFLRQTRLAREHAIKSGTNTMAG